MKRYSAWGHDGSFRFKWMAKLWKFFNKLPLPTKGDE